jgi:hypothetical protein
MVYPVYLPVKYKGCTPTSSVTVFINYSYKTDNDSKNTLAHSLLLRIVFLPQMYGRTDSGFIEINQGER